MKVLIVILAVCALGYVVDHRRDLLNPDWKPATANSHALILYYSKSYPACVRLEWDLKKHRIPYQKRDLDEEAVSRELTDKRARVGKRNAKLVQPVAEIDGVLFEGVTIDKVLKRIN